MNEIQPEIRPTIKQEAAWDKLLDKVTRFLLFGGGAGGGKTWLYCEWLLVQCYQHPGSRWFIGRNELKRLMSSTFVTWTKVCAHHKIPKADWKLDGKYNVIRFRNGSTIDLLDVKYLPTDPDYERLGSTEYNGGFGEEIGEWHFKAFDVLKSRIGRHKLIREGVDVTPFPKFGLSCNPTKSWPYRVFFKPWQEGTLSEGYAFIQSLYLDNPHTSEEYGRQLEEISDRALKQRLRDGNWDYDEGAGTLMRFENIRDMFSNTITKDGQKYLVVDVARYGRDKTVFNLWEGLESVKREYFEEQGTDKTVQLIRDYASRERVPFSNIIVDEDGVGGGVVDQLQGIKGFTANSSALPTKTMLRRQMLPSASLTIDGQRHIANFQNLKAQCAFKLAELVETHRIAARTAGDQDEIMEDLSQIKQKDMEKDGRLKIVGKDEVREAIGRSPDAGDTFLMRMFFELLRDATGGTHEQATAAMRRTFPRREIRPRGV